MTVTNQTSAVQYVGTGAQTTFSYPYLVSDLADLLVYIDNAQQFSGFTVTGIGDPAGGDVIFDIPPISGAVVALVRMLPLTQLMDYTAYDAFPAESHESALDKLTMIAQQLQSQSVIPLPPTIDAANIPYLASGTGAITRPVESRLRDRTSVADFGAAGIGGDYTAEIQAAITFASTGNGIVFFPAGTYVISTVNGTVTLPGSSAQMPYCISVPTNVTLLGEGIDNTILIGDHIYRTTPINTSQKIMFKLGTNGGNFYIEGMQIQSCMMPFYGIEILSGYMKQIAFSGCALPVIMQKAERFEFSDITFGTPAAGIVVGGWYSAGAVIDSSWADKCYFHSINYIRFLAGFTSTETNVDTFFDVNFFRNDTGALQVPYRGVVGIAICLIARYNNGCTANNFVGPFFAWGSPRPFLFGGSENNWNCLGPFFMERCGYTDDTLSTIMGVGQVDPWNSTRMKAFLEVIAQSFSSIFSGVWATSCAAIDVVSPSVGHQFNPFASAQANPDLINPKTVGEFEKAVMVKQLVLKRVIQTYSSIMTIDFKTGNEFDITVTNGTAFTIQYATADLTDGQRVTITVRNASGGALGAATWDTGFRMSAWTNPANGFSRSIDFKFNGANPVQVSQTGVDVPN